MNRRRQPLPLTLLTLVTLATPAGVPAADGERSLRLTTGIDFSEGSYGGDVDTRILYAPLKLEWRGEIWRGSISSGYVDLDEDGDSADTVSDSRTSGNGDVTLGLVYQHPFALGGSWYVDVVNQLTIPRDNSPGRLTYGLYQWRSHLDWYRGGETWTVFGSFGYRWFENTNTVVVDNGPIASLGVDYRLAPRCYAALMLDYRAASSDSREDALEWLPSLTWTPSRGPVVNIYGVFGDSDSSPDRGLGIQFIFK